MIGVDQGTTDLFSDFENKGAMWAGHGTRACRVRVQFNQPFKTKPVVHVGLDMWDQCNSTNQRGDLRTEKVDETGFDVVFTTWSDTRIARARASWLAIGEMKGDDEWELY